MGCTVGWQGEKVDSILIARATPDRPELQVRLIGPLNKSEVQSHVPWSCSHQVVRVPETPQSSGDTIPNSEKSSMVSLRQVSFGREEET